MSTSYVSTSALLEFKTKNFKIYIYGFYVKSLY